MLGEKDIIFLGAALLRIAFGGGSLDLAIEESVELYEKVFGSVSDDNLKKYVSKK